MPLAAKIRFDHPFAGGYPGIGSQPLPTDADAIDYLTRMAAADGAGVETGVAVAVDAFFRDAKESGVFSALKACCILAGARTLAGALVPVVGDAPTNVADGFVEGDYSRTAGLTGDGTSYIDSGRANDDDPQNDNHNAVYISATPLPSNVHLGSGGASSGANTLGGYDASGGYALRSRSSSFASQSLGTAVTNFTGSSRSASASFTSRVNGVSNSEAVVSQTPSSDNTFVFARNNGSGTPQSFSQATLAFYSIGTSLSLEDLGTAVTNLINRLKFALLVGENPSGLDPDTIDYIVRGYEAGGSLE